MNEQFMNKMYELYLDMLQDTRADAITEERYDTLICAIFNNLRLGYNGKELMINSDEKLMAVLQAIEPHEYNNTLEKLQKENNNEE